jgi:hypothetical protein
MNEGVKRLAMLMGGVGVLAWLVAVAVMTKVFSDMEHSPRVWGIIIGISVPCFLGPFGLVHAIAWVIRGFRQPTRNQEEQSSNKSVERTGAPPAGSDAP